MIWIYGGGFTGGSSSSPNTSGAQFAKQGVVLVAMNYRVARFGFFAFPALSKERPDETKGNYAYMDQIAALQWVQRNIAAFGGNPDNVTIFGFSAGGVSVHSMLASPMARGLFHKAIAESGGSRDSVLTARPMRIDGADPNYPVSAETIGLNFAKSVGIEGTDQAALASLRALSAEQVLRGAPPQQGAAPPPETTPILDGKLITETAEIAYLGDAHAAQGDGELSGNGLETSMDVEVRVDLLPGSSIPAPRAESSTHVMTMGLSSSLDDAVRKATTNMIEWLMAKYDLALPEVSQVVGTSAEYRVSVVVGRNAGIVIKLHKDRLRSLKPRG
jgi:hypothetical protein